MALQAIELADLETVTWAAPVPATVITITQPPRMVTIAAARRERRRWFALGTLLFAGPLAACLVVLEVIR
jgi:hypothetical protein